MEIKAATMEAPATDTTVAIIVTIALLAAEEGVGEMLDDGDGVAVVVTAKGESMDETVDSP